MNKTRQVPPEHLPFHLALHGGTLPLHSKFHGLPANHLCSKAMKHFNRQPITLPTGGHPWYCPPVEIMTKKHGCLVLAAALLAALLLESCSSKKPQEALKPPEEAGTEVVAQVNGVHIYAAELNLGVTRYEQDLSASGQVPDPEKAGEYRAAALQVLIENELLYQEAQRRGITAAKEAVDEELAAIAGQFPGTLMFEKALVQMNVTKEDLRRDLERAQSVQRMIETSIEPQVAVSAEEVRSYYDANPRLFTDPERIRARHILIRVGPNTPQDRKAQARQTLEGLRQRTLQGESFTALANEHSQDPTSGEGGDLGYFARGQLPKAFEEAAFALQTGEISGVVDSSWGYHLIQLLDRRPATPLGFERVKESLTGFLRKRKVDEAVAQLTKEMRAKAKISVSKRPR